MAKVKAKPKAKGAEPIIVCALKTLPEDQQVAAAEEAVRVNPANAPAVAALHFVLPPEHLAILTSRYWGAKGVDLSVQFLDNPPADVRAKILAYANKWNRTANVRFRETSGQGQIRLARAADGYWSYLGTDILQIPKNRPTMNLQGFTMKTPDSEYDRVVTHEFAHAVGCPHEHARREIVERIDPQKAIAYFGRTQGWNAEMVRQQVLTPLEEESLMGTPHAEETSVMAYSLPGEIMKDGKPVFGGNGISATDAAFIAKVYPLAVEPPPRASYAWRHPPRRPRDHRQRLWRAIGRRCLIRGPCVWLWVPLFLTLGWFLLRWCWRRFCAWCDDWDPFKGLK